MGIQIDDAPCQRFHIRLAQVGLCHAAVILEGADGRNEHHAGRVQAGGAALDIEKLLRAEVRAEAGLGDGDVRQLKGHLGGLHAVAAMGNVGKGAAVHEAGRALQGLHEVGLDGVRQQGGHGAVGLEVARVDRLTGVCIGDQDIAQTLFEVCQVVRQAQDGHDLGGDRNHEVVLARHAVRLTAKADGDVAQGAVIHVQDTGEQDAARINTKGIALLQMVVQHGTEQVVGRGDGVHVAGKVEVNVLHGNDLRIAAAGGAALDAKDRAQGGLPQGDDRVLAQLCHGLA